MGCWGVAELRPSTIGRGVQEGAGKWSTHKWQWQFQVWKTSRNLRDVPRRDASRTSVAWILCPPEVLLSEEQREQHSYRRLSAVCARLREQRCVTPLRRATTSSIFEVPVLEAGPALSYIWAPSRAE